MTEWWVVVAGGLLGSSHCVGMCGGFALSLGNQSLRLATNLARQVIYGLGRVFTYSTAGAVAGYGGWRLTGLLPSAVPVQALLAVVAGVLLVYQGLAAAGVLPGVRVAAGGPCLASGMFAALFRATRLRSVFLGGVINGLLPCGLVYAYLALAASAGGLFRGWATMALFGLGTLPVLALVGCGSSFLRLAFRRRLLTAAGWCVVLTGMISVARGLAFLHGPRPGGSDCPFCP